MTGRKIDAERITSERFKLQECFRQGVPLETDVQQVEEREIHPNPISENEVGVFRSPEARKAVIADMERLQAFQKKPSSSFLPGSRPT